MIKFKDPNNSDECYVESSLVDLGDEGNLVVHHYQDDDDESFNMIEIEMHGREYGTAKISLNASLDDLKKAIAEIEASWD